MSIEALEGRTYGAHTYRICREKVVEFVAATGDDPDRWSESAPPGMAAALLFVVAPDMLNDPLVDGAVVHGDQQFQWYQRLEVGTDLTVKGTVDKVRKRGEAAFVIFNLAATADSVPVVEGRSTFVVGSSVAGVSEVKPRPVHEGGSVSSRQKSASRADLVRYAAATRDWNPIHWDHETAVNGGLGGVVVHGLLQSAWLTQIAALDRPIESARFRYASVLRPGQTARIDGEPKGEDFELRLVADERVTVSGKFKVAK